MKYTVYATSQRGGLSESVSLLVGLEGSEPYNLGFSLDDEVLAQYNVLIVLRSDYAPMDLSFCSRKSRYCGPDNRPVEMGHDYACYVWVTLSGNRRSWVETSLQNAFLHEGGDGL